MTQLYALVLAPAHVVFEFVLERAPVVVAVAGTSTTTTVSYISIVGVGMKSNVGVAQKMFETLAKKNINIQVISTSEIKISVLINKKNTSKAILALHKEFKLDK